MYLIDGFDGNGELPQLGKASHGKRCLRLAKSDQIDLDVLSEMVTASYRTPHPDEVAD